MGLECFCSNPFCKGAKIIEIKFIPTGHVFSLPDDEAIRIVNEDRGNYKVIKGKVPGEKKPKEEKSVKELVVVNKTDNKSSGNLQKQENKSTETKNKSNKNKEQGNKSQ